MPDMLVRLYALPDVPPPLPADVRLRRANPWELSAVRSFVANHFATTWADELSVGFANKPVSVHVAVKAGEIIGFAAHECTRRGFFGPTGVLESHRGQGVGKALLIAGLIGLRDLGYAYAIIGGVGPAEFYARACGALPIPDSTPGIYGEPLKKR